MNYTLHQLQIFIEVCKQKSITKAAEAMHMTQPALSIQLKNFQNQFDIALTEIIGKKLYVTEFGESVCEIAKNIISEANELKYKTKEYKGLLTGTLNIASVSTGKYLIPYYLNEFMNNKPGVDLVLDVSNKTQVIKNLRENSVDFALVSVLPDSLELEQEILLDNHLFLVGKNDNFNKNSPLIFREKGSATRMAMDNYFSERGKRKTMSLTSNEAVKQAVIAGLGYSVLPLIGIKNALLSKEIQIIEAKNLPIVTKWRLVWLKNKKLSPVAKSFLNYIQESKTEIEKQYFAWTKNFSSIEQV